MPTLDLNKAFPAGKDGSHKPLPKQEELLQIALDPKGPKYIRYCGGVGSGKTLIGCITTLTWAVLYPGDYLVARQFMPELKITTLKTFLEICPPELIVEHRIADAIIRIKCAQGGVSNIIFRGLDEPEKLKSLNLNAFHIDEASQVSEEAFLLLQGRLRGKYVRKGILTTNSGGHDWGWRMFVDKSMFKNDWVKAQFHSIKAPSTENVHLPDGYVESMLQTWSEDRIKREVLADEDSFTGQVYGEFKRELHVVKPFRIPETWERHIRIDHGFRNPAAALFFAVNPEGEVYLYKEFYESEWLIHEIINGKKENATYFKGVNALAMKPEIGPGDKPVYEKFVSVKIDPSTKNRSGVDGESPFDEYYRVWPRHFPPLGYAKNDVQVGIDRVKSYLKPHKRSGKPLFYIFDTCVNTLEEISVYRFPELKAGQESTKSEPEKPVKVKDHAMDAMRYMIVDLPDPAQTDDLLKKHKYRTLEGSLASELEKVHKPSNNDEFGKGFL